MFESLVDHAFKNTWFNGGRNRELQIKLKRFSPENGFINVFPLFNNTFRLPVERTYSHVFYVTGLTTMMVEHMKKVKGFRKQLWFKLEDLVNDTCTDYSLFTSKGLFIPRNSIYYTFVDDSHIVMAVNETAKLNVSWGNEEFILRCFHNYHYGSNGFNVEIKATSFKPRDTEEILVIERDLRNRKAGKYFFVYVNGFISNDFALGNISPLDQVEFVTDNTVMDVDYWKYNELHNFSSETDNCNKYLLNSIGDENETLSFCEDNDFYLFYQPENHYAKGIRVLRKSPCDITMVSHRDYAVKKTVLDEAFKELNEFLGIVDADPNDFYVMVMKRNSSLRRKASLTNPVFKKLYDLDSKERTRGLKGQIPAVRDWEISKIESSSFVKLLRSDPSSYTVEKVVEAYGYFKSSEILGETPLRVLKQPNVQLPNGCSGSSVVFEFNSEGLLLGYSNSQGVSYRCKNKETSLIETLIGEGRVNLSKAIGKGKVEVLPYLSEYRVYSCEGKETPNGKWKDITDSDLYIIEEDHVVSKDSKNSWLMFLSDKHILVNNISLRSVRGVLSFTLKEYPNGQLDEDPQILPFPMGQLDIWMNKRKLIQGLDYFVLFPNVFITNKAYLRNENYGELQDIVYRYNGLPDKDFKSIEDTLPGGFGWVFNGYLSSNVKAYLGDLGAFQFNIGGCIFHPEEVTGNISYMNGYPYEHRDLLLPLKSNGNFSTYELREKDRRLQEVFAVRSGTYSLKPPPSSNKYEVVSPFFSALIFAVSNSLLEFDKTRRLSDEEVSSICSPFAYLLKVDPILKNERIDGNVVKILASNSEYIAEVDPASFNLLKTVERLFGDNKIDINESIRLK